MKTILGGKAQPVEHRHRGARRPFSVTLLAEGSVLLGAFYLIRFYQALKQWDFLVSLPGVSPLYLALTGLAWFLLACGVGIVLWRGARWAPLALQALALAFTLYSWIDRAFVAHEAPDAWPFLAILNVLVLAWVFLALRSQGAREFFRGSYERKIED